jgi:hypothetical protein
LQCLCLMHRFFLVCVLGLSGCGATDTGSFECKQLDTEFDQELNKAQACSPGDTCVLTGGTACTCAIPVNAAHNEAIIECALKITCTRAVDCPHWVDLRCENRRCTGTPG